MKVEITNNINKEHLADVKNWLTEEGDGFINNWSSIEKCFNDGEMYCAISNGKVLGFLVHSTFSLYAEISIMEIHPNHRRQGIGRQLVNAFFDDLRSDGVLVVRLESNPTSSLPFWRSFGFLPVGGSTYQLYLPLIDVVLDDDCEDEDEVIEIYDTNFGDDSVSLPAKVLKIERDSSGEILKPIVTPYSPQAKLRWKKGNHVHHDGTMKSFPYRKQGYGLFIVTELDNLFIETEVGEVVH